MLNLAKWNGMRAKNITHHGYEFDVVISAIQKYLRRRETEKMLYFVKEAYTMHGVGGKAGVTNLLNRLLVMSAEELIFAETTVIGKIYTVQKIFEKDRNNIGALLTIASMLVNARLCRLPSDYRAFYSMSDPPQIDARGDDTHNVPNKHTNPDVAINVDRFYACLKAKSKDCFYYLFKVFDMSEEGSKSEMKYFKHAASVYILWAILNKVDKGRHTKTLNILLEWFEYPRRERFQYLVNACLLVLHSNEVPAQGKILTFTYSSEGNIQIMKDHLASPKMELDSYVIDKHTRAGRKNGMTTVDFANDGCLVVNEDKQYLVPALRANYIKVRSTPEAPKPKKRKADSNDFLFSPVSPKKPRLSHLTDFDWYELVGDEPIFFNGGKVCGAKGVCFSDTDGFYVLKEVTSATQYGSGYLAMDGLKKNFGLEASNAHLITTSNVIRRKDLSNHCFIDNWKLETPKTKPIYLKMSKFPGKPIKFFDKWEQDQAIRFMYLEIVLVRSLFACSDSNASNIMYDGEKCYSIDEAVLFNEKCTQSRILGQTNKDMRKAFLSDYNAGRLDGLFVDLQSFPLNRLVDIASEFGYGNQREFLKQRQENLKKLFLEEVTK